MATEIPPEIWDIIGYGCGLLHPSDILNTALSSRYLAECLVGSTYSQKKLLDLVLKENYNDDLENVLDKGHCKMFLAYLRLNFGYEDFEEIVFTRSVTVKIYDIFLPHAKLCRELFRYINPSAHEQGSKSYDLFRCYICDRYDQLAVCDRCVNVSPLYRSLKCGYVDTAKIILADPRVDPSARENDAMLGAAIYGHEEIGKMLLSDPRVDPAAYDNGAIYLACLNGHLKMTQLLLEDPRVDPSGRDEIIANVVFRYNMCIIDHIDYLDCLDLVKLLLADSRANPCANGYQAIRYALRGHRIDMVRLLLTDSRVDVGEVFRMAIDYGCTSIVKDLLEDGVVDPALNDNALYVPPPNRKYDKIFGYLLAASPVLLVFAGFACRFVSTRRLFKYFYNIIKSELK